MKRYATCAVTIHLNVTDPEKLFTAALDRALENGLSEEDARSELRTEDGVNIGNCARILLDPGISPDGCEILDSTAGKLLAALVELVERAEAAGNIDGLPEYDQARAAIAEARGEEQP
jgi:hypothetical protein